MVTTFGKTKQSTALIGLVSVLLVSGVAPLLDEHPAAAEKRGSSRKVERFENREQRIGFIEGPSTVVTSRIEVGGFETPVTDVEVTLFGIFHGGNAGENSNSSDDMDVLLVGPDGQVTLLLSDVGGTTTTNVSHLVLDDQASQSLPDNAALSSGTFRPTNFDSPDPIPGFGTPPGSAALAVFNGSDPNGVWTLWARDDTVNGIPAAGSGINGGWALTITTANGVPDAVPDDFKTKAGRTLRIPAAGVLENDSDPDDDVLTASLANPPRKGKVALEADGSFTYKANKKAKGKDSFTYQAKDSSGLNAQATVNIQIKGQKHKKHQEERQRRGRSLPRRRPRVD